MVSTKAYLTSTEKNISLYFVSYYNIIKIWHHKALITANGPIMLLTRPNLEKLYDIHSSIIPKKELIKKMINKNIQTNKKRTKAIFVGSNNGL